MKGSGTVTQLHLHKHLRCVTCRRANKHLQRNTSFEAVVAAGRVTAALTYKPSRQDVFVFQTEINKQVIRLLFSAFIDLTRSRYFWSSFCLFIYFLAAHVEDLKGICLKLSLFSLLKRNINLFCWLQRHIHSIFLFFVGVRDNMKESASSEWCTAVRLLFKLEQKHKQAMCSRDRCNLTHTLSVFFFFILYQDHK